MKFGAKLQTFVVPEWQDKYIRYKELVRLLKRASRLRSANIPGVEDDEERSLLHNLFTIDAQVVTPAFITSAGSADFSSKTEFIEEAPARSQSAGHIVNRSDHCVINIDESELIDTKLFAGASSESFVPSNPRIATQKSHTWPREDTIFRIADQYEREGTFSTSGFRTTPETDSRLNVALHNLDRVASVFEGDTRSNTQPCEHNDQYSTPVRKVVSAIVHRQLPYRSAVVYGHGDDATSPSNKDGCAAGNRRSHVTRHRLLTDSRRLSSKVRFCFSIKGFRICTSGIPRPRFNLKKNTPQMQDECLSVFDKVLRDDIRVVVSHYVTEMDYIKSLISFLKADIRRRGSQLDGSYAGLIRKACTAFWDAVDKLQFYLNLNTLAVFKVLKKKDKLMATGDIFNLYPTYKSIMLSLDNSRGILDDVAQMYNSLMEVPVIEFGVLKSDMESTLDSLRPKPAHGLFFIYGLCTVLMANSLFLCSFEFPLPFDTKILSSQIAAFRFFFVVSLIWFGFGWCQNYLESYGVNYQFQFGISSNYSATEKDYYLMGALQTLSCLMLFVFFLLDCKLHVVPTHHMYCFYPVLLILSHVVTVTWPNRNLKLKLRKRLFICLLRVVGAPFGAGDKVTLSDSIIADVLTSLTRPLRDLVCMITYFAIGVTSDHKVVSPVVQNWIVPFVMCYPYVIRFSQCLRRYINEKRLLHIGNMMKYVSGMLCVVVSSIDWVAIFQMRAWVRYLVVISCYVIATLYQCWWDYVVDWGLNIGWNIFRTRQNRMMYRRNAYYMAVVFNMLCRCTWALTTIPFTILHDKDLSSDIIFLIVSVIEIVRRVVWVTFRLESEHLLNSYKYRTALWVPKLYNCKNLIVKEMKMLNEQM
ncbi:EXS family protein, putative [Babesia bigemina]|uniref:EXS family protein, putative n=1 Tax=Babesia bigemina TaxID=5866 RepID=A0A061D1H4_BABBI|nr:EXS family protein, putative [Babesia bigemina]CDR93972.1 EXS family protein, putative [Babesia bigemina]|eukprot:XP_012766158.1 EXS family protein, putative [Babesia bigemina]